MMEEKIPGLRVFKFGGASVKDAASILNVCDIVRAELRRGGPLLVVVSAMGKTTNALEEIFDLAWRGTTYHTKLAHLKEAHWAAASIVSKKLGKDKLGEIDDLYEGFDEIFQELNQSLTQVNQRRDHAQQYDLVVSTGELLASRLLAAALLLVCETTWLDCRSFVRTNRTWREGQVDWPTTEQQLQTHLSDLIRKALVVTQGFIGGTANGQTTTLGREGSDYSAAIFAYCLDAESVTIWKDVPGLLSADPKVFPEAVLYPEISYQETIEMAYYGASVIHPKTLKPLAEKGIPLYVRSFLDPGAPGTVIHDCRHPPLAPAVIRKTGQGLLSFASKDFAFISEANLEVIFGALAAARLKINLMQNSALSFSAVVDFDRARVEKLLAALGGQFRIQYNADLTLFTIKNYDAATAERLTAGRELLLEQRSRATFQFVVRA